MIITVMGLSIALGPVYPISARGGSWVIDLDATANDMPVHCLRCGPLNQLFVQ